MVVMSAAEKQAKSVEVRSPRRFDPKYKLAVLDELDAATEPGEVGRILRREGLYSSLIVHWRRQRDAGALAGVTDKKRGRKKVSQERLELMRLREENERLRERLATIEELVDAQGKVSALLQKVSREHNSGK